jgi:hypothetical protein
MRISVAFVISLLVFVLVVALLLTALTIFAPVSEADRGSVDAITFGLALASAFVAGLLVLRAIESAAARRATASLDASWVRWLEPGEHVLLEVSRELSRTPEVALEFFDDPSLDTTYSLDITSFAAAGRMVRTSVRGEERGDPGGDDRSDMPGGLPSDGWRIGVTDRRVLVADRDESSSRLARSGRRVAGSVGLAWIPGQAWLDERFETRRGDLRIALAIGRDGVEATAPDVRRIDAQALASRLGVSLEWGPAGTYPSRATEWLAQLLVRVLFTWIAAGATAVLVTWVQPSLDVSTAMGLVATVPLVALAIEAVTRLTRSRSSGLPGGPPAAPRPIGPMWRYIVVGMCWVVAGVGASGLAG